METADDDVALVARSLADGKELRRDDLPGDGQAWSETTSGAPYRGPTEALPGVASLLEDNEGLIVQVFAGPETDGEWRLYDPDDGELRWKTELDQNLYDVTRQGDRFLGISGGQVVAYRVDNGEEAWSEPSNGR